MVVTALFISENQMEIKLGANPALQAYTQQPIKRWIHVKFSKEGVHCYPAAATDPKLATGGWDYVSFLANPHFHYFHFKVSIEVFQNDRDIEFKIGRASCRERV